MPAHATLTVKNGKLKGQAYQFKERTICLAGRSSECRIRLPDDEDHKTISRFHCLFDINPPHIRVRDFGSLNGTYVNDEMIGRRQRGQSPSEASGLPFPERDLRDGDKIKLGATVLNVALPPAPKMQKCGVCRQAVPGKPGSDQGGKIVCEDCKGQAGRLADVLMAGKQPELPKFTGYQVLKELGRGGMGAVYLARHEKTDELVAIKFMLPEVALQEDKKDKFLREARIACQLTHPNLVPTREPECSAGAFFIVMEYCAGGSVGNRQRQAGGKIPSAEAVPLILQALDGLDYAHRANLTEELADRSLRPVKGIVHRDLKPDNLLLCGAAPNWTVKIGDYGLAKAFDLAGLSGHTMTGQAAGTLGFMPRQQLINYKRAKPEVDVWAMAASLYFLLTGSPPREFPEGKDPVKIVLEKRAVPIRRRLASIPRKLAEVIDTALIDQPAIHFQTAADLQRALESAFES